LAEQEMLLAMVLGVMRLLVISALLVQQALDQVAEAVQTKAQQEQAVQDS
jgi:hypothetical protein